MKTANERFYSGMSGVALPMRRAEYPTEFQSKSRLQYYASMFNSVEVNSIFYKLPRNATVANWRESVPDYFRFTFKVSKNNHTRKGVKLPRRRRKCVCEYGGRSKR